MVSGEEEDGEVDHFFGARDGDSFASKAAEPVPLAAIILLDTDGECL